MEHRSAYIEDLEGVRYVDFNVCNLHVVSYSEPINTVLSFDDLEKHLHYRPDLPNAIPMSLPIEKYWGLSYLFLCFSTKGSLVQGIY